MALWEVISGPNRIQFGTISSFALSPSGCNQPFRGRFWCPRKKWFLLAPCPFASRAECDTFRRMAGAV